MATMWNFRRQILQHLHPDPVADEKLAARRAASEVEFKLTQECLMSNPKSYPVWFHRMWVLEWGECSWQWKTDLKLTAKMLALDDRNFHCWTYRRFVVRQASVPLTDELAFTMGKINANFSNYSAWHYRSKLLPQLYKPATDTDQDRFECVLREELALLRNAFFTAPEDQSAWFYHRWLLAQLEERLGTATTAMLETLQEELNMLNELLELEPDCKWPLATVSFIAKKLSLPADTRLAQLKMLQSIDPMRSQHYKHQLTLASG
uniref:Geranylgeranyl transferase type-2 subunit alpha n=1 Tax=Calcidiscus leptoporus TaxID=127549 RepID=A0A7S0JGG3_9EUKA